MRSIKKTTAAVLVRWRKFGVSLLCSALLLADANAGSEEGAAGSDATNRYYMDLGWRTPAGVAKALTTAEATLAADPDAVVEILVHGKDMRLFVNGAQRRNPGIVALSDRLAGTGQVRFRVCDHALNFKGYPLERFPDHFGTVDYVPERVNELRDKGYASLHR